MADSLHKNFETLRSIFDEVLRMKNSTGERDRSEEFTEKRKYASLLFVLIKKVNRMVKYSLRSGREDLHREKVRVDSNRLHLQNLLYEVNHLKREIRYCHKFKSQDEDIELVPENEEPTENDKELMPTNVSPLSGHAKHLARLERELNLRKQLAAQCKELLNTKQQVFRDIVLKTEKLTSFAPSLRTLMKATRPLQEALQVPMDREWKLQQLVQLLPRPLYLAYMNIHAIELAKECDVCVVVLGCEDDVRQLELAAQTETIKSGASSDTDEIDVSSVAKKRKTHGGNSELLVDLMQEQRKRILQPHPLEVRFTIGNGAKSMDESIAVKLRYFKRLGFITAATVVSLSDADQSFADATLTQDVLKYLNDDDMGETIPVPGAEYELKNINMTTKECVEYLNSKDYGRPYRWLQTMCCIEVFNEISDASESVVVPEPPKLQKLIPDLIKSIQHLWTSRLNLIKQIRALVQKQIDLYLKEERLPTTRPACSLVQWTALTYEEYLSSAPYTDCELINGNQLFYRAVVVRGSAKMECLVSISSKFPAESPIWFICIYWNGQHNAANSAAVKSMEFWTNSLTQAMLQHPLALLATQLVRTMYSFDIFLETEGPLYNPVEYHREKHYIKAFAKRIRARPYRYIEGGTVNTFKQ
ncbi:THO complex subunit 5-like [Rhagoletis pomonella]|uniref:THO complex subunit 5-like n=1 Tax=Rhagoletis pomonella TaxID=28610 RepID=UPI00177C3C8A|nr:THO complex subunit 5-like [Rhagoletis pomonella]XP_036345888.1 THO complex subunit 5-like [Rhagoletis pomonella]